MTYITLKELVKQYAERYNVSLQRAMELIQEDFQAIRDDIAIDRKNHYGIFSTFSNRKEE